eukprot:5765877-Amphidinium_carterae.1
MAFNPFEETSLLGVPHLQAQATLTFIIDALFVSKAAGLGSHISRGLPSTMCALTLGLSRVSIGNSLKSRCSVHVKSKAKS